MAAVVSTALIVLRMESEKKFEKRLQGRFNGLHDFDWSDRFERRRNEKIVKSVCFFWLFAVRLDGFGLSYDHVGFKQLLDKHVDVFDM